MLTWRELDITSPVGDLADFGIFEILGEAGDISNSTSMPNYRDEPSSDLGVCVKKVLRA